jgi:hypothetical protein
VDGVLAVTAAESFRLPAGRFSRLGFIYDRDSLRLSVDGALVASEAGTSALKRDRAAILRVGSAGQAFTGVVDEIKLHAVAGRETVKLPQDVAIASAPPFIQFDASGRLDPQFHAGGLVAVFALASGGRKALFVSVLGGVQLRDIAQRAADPASAATGGHP